mgnify:CR=1 FL=1
MSNAEQFLNHFNEIERWLKSTTGYQNHLSFIEMLHQCKERNAIVRRFFDDLHQFASLRNAIVHTRRNNRPIAEPYDETVKALESIKNELLRPPLVPKTPNVFVVRQETELEHLLVAIKNYDYSQVPVLDNENKVIEVINTNTIARWLSEKTVDDIISLKETFVKDLLPHIEHSNNYKLISRTINLYEAASIFQKTSSVNKHNLDAILITENGHNSERLIGILCLEDLAEYFLKEN